MVLVTYLDLHPHYEFKIEHDAASQTSSATSRATTMTYERGDRGG